METKRYTVSGNPEDASELIKSYERFVPKQILGILGKKDIREVKLGDQIEKNLTILFSDIRDFTTLSESMNPKENFEFINSYLSQMETYITVYHGFIDKYIGDSIMAIFPTKADDAVDCSLLMLQQLSYYNEDRKKDGQKPINIGIGLNTGLCMFGTVGGYDRMEGTVISDAVNLSSRIESLTKKYGVQFLIGEGTMNNIKDHGKYSFRFIDRVMVKGKNQSQSIYEVFNNDDTEARELKIKTLPVFEEALAYYHYKDIPASLELLNVVLSINPADKPAKFYAERCKSYLKTGFHESPCDLNHIVEWSSDFEVGNPVIDSQHRQMFNESVKLLKSIRKDVSYDDIEKIIVFLNDYIINHFRTEEEFLANRNYPFLDHQIWQHQNFIRSFENLKREIASDTLSKVYLKFRIQILVIDWILNHIMKEDRHFGNYFRNKR
jgi:hemerythrin